MLFGNLHRYQVRIERTTTAQVGQAIRGSPVNVALIRAEPRPPDRRCGQYTRTNFISYFCNQPAPSPFVTYAYQLSAANISCSGITRMYAQRRSAFLGNQPFLIAKSRTDKMVGIHPSDAAARNIRSEIGRAHV